MLISLVMVMLAVLCGHGAHGTLGLDLPPDHNIKDGDSFEYIVVGAGAAGVPAASRLALAGANVLLIEHGGDPNLITRIPGLSMSLAGTDLDWQYPTEPNNVSCLSAPGKACRVSRGKCLGGSSSITDMVYTRGNRRDFDDLNITGWTWDDVKPYFLRYEGLQDLDKLPVTSIPYHNTTGIMKIGYVNDSGNLWHPRFFEGFEDLNITYNVDVNAESQIGTSRVFTYVYDNERVSTATAYLANDDIKKKIKVSRYTTCTGVLIDDEKIARGVTVEHGRLLKKKKTLYATKEVILCAGAIGTPQILMLSGIGPADHLKEIGINLRVDLPVGDDMSDHVLLLAFFVVDPGFGVNGPNIFVYGTQAVQVVQWLLNKSGPLASTGLNDEITFLNTLCYDFDKRQLFNNHTDCELPSLQITIAYIDRNIISSSKSTFKNIITLNDDIVDQISDANVKNALITVVPIIMRPYSRGTLRLKSKDPLEYPYIMANYLADERDVEEMLRSFTILEHLVDTPTFKEHNVSILHLQFDKCPKYEVDREAYLRCYVRHMSHSAYRTVGSTAIGRVVDERLRVRGIKRLRVGDLGVMPSLPRGNTQACAVAIGERMADFLLDNNDQ